MSRPRFEAALLAVITVALVLWPLVTGAQTFELQRAEYILSGVLVAVGLNVVTGFAGQLSLGPGAIFAVGGYTAALLAEHYPTQVGLLLMCLAGIAAGGLLGLLIGVPALRVGGFYLGMTTLFFALLVPLVASNLDFTGKDRGISLLGNADFAPVLHDRALYFVTLAVIVACVLLSWLLLESRVGHRFVTIAASEELTASLGISAYRSKLLAFYLSALPAGLGGAFYVYTQQFVSPGSVSPTLSIYLLAACVIGGFGTVVGPFVGGLLVLGLSQYLGSLAAYQGIVFGGLLVAFSILLPEGLVGAGQGNIGRPAWARALGIPARRFRVARDRTGAGESRVMPQRTPAASVSQLLQGGPRGGLRISSAVRSFGGIVAVDQVSLEVPRGTVHGLIGSNGSGKTTLLNLASGFYALEAGEVWLGEERADRRAAYRVAQAGTARTFQTPKLVERASVLTNVVLAAESAVPCRPLLSTFRLPSGRRADRAARERAHACLRAVGLETRQGEPASAQPHGVRRLVEVARALAANPGVLLLDEPAAGLAMGEIEVLAQVIRDAADAGVAILLVEHNVPLVLSLCDQVTVMHQGRTLLTGTPDDIRRAPEVARSFLGGSEPPLAGRPT
jgi:ABC-type branched-subunit amino acid transport system ATPase component/ABC-type branched-subunit amino acid transport system permease subunit